MSSARFISYRKLITYGQNQLVITLPNKWVRQYGLLARDYISVSCQDDTGDLIVGHEALSDVEMQKGRIKAKIRQLQSEINEAEAFLRDGRH